MECQSMQQSLDEATEKYKREREMSIVLSRDMSRQYKGMQEELLTKINARETKIQELTDELNSTIRRYKGELDDKDEIIRDKNAYIAKLQEKMEGLCIHFAKMLQEALAQMKERINAQSSSYDVTNVPIQQRMEEFNLKQQEGINSS